MTLPTKLYHYCGEPIEKLYDSWIEFLISFGALTEEAKEEMLKNPSEYNGSKFFKPYGLWFSVEDHEGDQTWKTWSETEKFNLECLKLRYLVKIKSDSKILLISTPEELEEFSSKHASNDPNEFSKFREERYSKYASQLKEDSILCNIHKPYIYQIKWKEIQEKYDGIIIAPYQWSCRLINPTTSWYYAWDCVSGCIWNTKCIEIELDTEYTHESSQVKSSTVL